MALKPKKPTKTISARGEIGVQIDGRAFKLVPSFENISAVEDVTDCGLYELAGMYREGRLKLRHMAAVFATVAVPSISPDDLRAVVEKEGIAELSAALGGFLSAAITGGEEVSSPGKKRATKS